MEVPVPPPQVSFQEDPMSKFLHLDLQALLPTERVRLRRGPLELS